MGKEHFEEISIVLILFKKRIEIQIYVDTVCCMLIRFSCGPLFATLWTVSHQAPLSMGFSNSGSKNTGVGCHALLQGISPIQGSNLGLLCPLRWQVGYHWRHLGSPQLLH